MVSIKLKVENKTTKYYGKFDYKLKITHRNLRWTHTTDNAADAKALYDFDVKSFGREFNYLPWQDEDLKVFKKIFKLKNKLPDDKSITFRREGDSLSLYSNDLDLLKTYAKGFKNVSFSRCEPSPDGVKYFINEPPAKYRVYASNKRIALQDKLDLVDYLQRTTKAKPSPSFNGFLLHPSPHYLWLYSGYFIDLEDESILTMFRIQYPDMIGKVYKLEKKI